MEKENFINAILNSTNGMTPVLPNGDLFSKIERRLQEARNVPPRTVWWVAASIAVLVAVNVIVFAAVNKTPDNQATAAFSISLDKSNQLY